MRENYLDVRTLARKYLTAESFWHKNITAGRIRAYKVGRLLRFLDSDAQTFIREPARRGGRHDANGRHHECTRTPAERETARQ